MLKRTLRRLRGKEKSRLVVDGPPAGTRVIFRAELMPGRETEDRTYEVERVLASGRIELTNLHGEHHLTEFEPVTQE